MGWIGMHKEEAIWTCDQCGHERAYKTGVAILTDSEVKFYCAECLELARRAHRFTTKGN